MGNQKNEIYFSITIMFIIVTMCITSINNISSTTIRITTIGTAIIMSTTSTSTTTATTSTIL